MYVEVRTYLAATEPSKSRVSVQLSVKYLHIVIAGREREIGTFTHVNDSNIT